MISVSLTNEMLDRILSIEKMSASFQGSRLTLSVSLRMRKNSQKRSAHSSLKIEGSPLTEQQAIQAIEDPHRHLLKPEEEVRNYYAALQLLTERLDAKEPVSLELMLEVQKQVVAGAGKEKIGLRGAMPPGFVFAVYDSETGEAEYLPPEASDIEGLLEELFRYLVDSDDHPLVKAGVLHYQIATMHPFEDGNGRTARLLSGYLLDLSGFGFGGVGSLEEYFAYNVGEYYESLQMGLPALYYAGRNNPPHPEIWMHYFLRMVELYAQRASQVVQQASDDQREMSLAHVSKREREFYERLVSDGVEEFTPSGMAERFGVTNRTIINWSASLAKVGLLEPVMASKRIRRYKVLR